MSMSASFRTTTAHHPNDLGYALMGNYIDLGLFKNQAAWSNGH
jgi:hypothetical protein